MPALQLNLVGHGPIRADIGNLVIAGWTGRDKAMVEHHIVELEAIGVKRPRTVPCFYRVAADLLSTEPSMQVPGRDSSGEGEFVLLSTEHGLLVGLGSDHTDRVVESYGVTVSKQMCAKPLSTDVWRLADLEDHWDQLQMRTWRERDGERVLYQEGPVTRMLTPRELISRYAPGGLPAGTAMFCGTQPIIADMGFGDVFEMELFDPVRQASLRLKYAIEVLPVED